MTTSPSDQRGLREGYRSGLEESVAEDLKERRVNFRFEPYKIKYTQPTKERSYLPDFEISQYDRIGDAFRFILVETKGRFVTADRQKQLLIKNEFPHLDIRFVFQNPNQKLSKKSKTTYAMWCDKHGFKWAKKTVPEEWLI